MMSYSPVYLLPCRLLVCWRGSRGPHPWCGHSSEAFLRGKPRTCHRDGHSNRSAPEPAGGETRLAKKWGDLDRKKFREKKPSTFRQIRFWVKLSASVLSVVKYSCFSDMKVASVLLNTDRGLWSLRLLSRFSVHLCLLCFSENLTF